MCLVQKQNGNCSGINRIHGYCGTQGACSKSNTSVYLCFLNLGCSYNTQESTFPLYYFLFFFSSLLFSKDTEVDLIQNTIGKLSTFKVEAGKVICRNFKTSLLEIRFCVFFVR